MSDDFPFYPCPYCQSNDIILVRGDGGSGNLTSGVKTSLLGAVFFDRLICLDCGSVREWVTSKHQRELLRKKYR